ncbi:uncharacterized protein [Typha angustifolia]|uniref:uncharacterized protein n=1 Tax=Typha angustifolia TaxID=59011 RepID=UPI003C2CEDA7
MDSVQSPVSCASAHDSGAQKEVKAKEAEAEAEAWQSRVDPFLVEALENPRHRLIVLRMELDIQKFMQNSDLHEFEFQHFPTSYLRCAAHRVAQHYGLETMAAGSIVDGSCSKIIARKTSESRSPAISLSEIPSKLTESETAEHLKVVIRQRPNKASQSDALDVETKKSLMKTVEERKEEYDKARARIFCDSNITDIECPFPTTTADKRNLCLGKDEIARCKRLVEESEKINIKDSPPRVAVFRDREKDRYDPDYDRSYERYVSSVVPGHNYSLGTFNALQPPMLQYEAGYLQSGNFPRNQATLNYQPSDTTMSPVSGVGCQQTFRNAVYVQWPMPWMMHPHCYHNLTQTIQVPFYQSFDHLQNG